MTWQYWVLVESLIVGGGILFVVLGHLGQKLIVHNESKYQIANTESKILHVYENKIDMDDCADDLTPH
jgi:hypothetical protein